MLFFFFAVSRVSRLTRLTAKKKNYTTIRFFCYAHLQRKKKNYTNYNIHLSKPGGPCKMQSGGSVWGKVGQTKLPITLFLLFFACPCPLMGWGRGVILITVGCRAPSSQNFCTPAEPACPIGAVVRISPLLWRGGTLQQGSAASQVVC